MHCLHVISGLGDGGAEAVLYRLCEHDNNNSHDVISLTGSGKYGLMLESIGVSVTTLNMSSRSLPIFAFIRLVRVLRQERPDVVQTWMYHGDLIGGVAARLAGIRRVIWGIRHTTLEAGKSKKTTVWIAKVLAKISRWLPAKIVVCSQAAMDVHEALDYDRRKMRFIPNGYDLSDFKPGLDPYGDLRTALAPDLVTPLIGTVARFDPQKDHANLLDSLAILRDRGLKFQCLLVGSGSNHSIEKIVKSISERDLDDFVQLLGSRSDIPEIMNILDLHVLPSAFGEAFPNVVAEAMACGTPCVVTDVGDAAYIVGDTGWVVPPRDATTLADAIALALSSIENPSESIKLSRNARVRIEQNFGIDRMVEAYRAVWQEAIEGPM